MGRSMALLRRPIRLCGLQRHHWARAAPRWRRRPHDRMTPGNPQGDDDGQRRRQVEVECARFCAIARAGGRSALDVYVRDESLLRPLRLKRPIWCEARRIGSTAQSKTEESCYPDLWPGLCRCQAEFGVIWAWSCAAFPPLYRNPRSQLRTGPACCIERRRRWNARRCRACRGGVFRAPEQLIRKRTTHAAW